MHASALTATWTGSGGARGHRGDDLVVGDRLGAYQVLGLLGEGGMARVYLAEHTVIERRVAIKRLLPALARFPEARDLFLREARITASIRHANLVDVYDFGSDAGGRPYYVMELAPGETLAARLARGPMLISQALDVAIVLAEAVSAIHHAGYLHRDIKSENVLLGRDGRRLVPKLIDFGIARPIGANGTATVEGVVGTPRTMAPEQVAQDVIDVTTDVWALGVVLYEMVSGRLPFSGGDSVREDLMAIVMDPPHPLPVHLDGGVRDVIDACLTKDPAGRPPSALALAQRLRDVQGAYLERRGMIDRGGLI
jgi:serine/threonine-protein kinase